MAERLTQLQDCVNFQSENFCNSIGILQEYSQPSYLAEFEKNSSVKSNTIQNGHNEDYAQLFASLIAKTAKEIDILIDSLPSEESSSELQPQLRQLEIENIETASKLEQSVRRGEKLLEQIQTVLQDIAQSQLQLTKK